MNATALQSDLRGILRWDVSHAKRALRHQPLAVLHAAHRLESARRRPRKRLQKWLQEQIIASSHEYPCTDCHGDAYIGLSNWRGPEGRIIGKKERLCLSCAQKRGISNPLHS